LYSSDDSKVKEKHVVEYLKGRTCYSSSRAEENHTKIGSGSQFSWEPKRAVPKSDTVPRAELLTDIQ